MNKNKFLVLGQNGEEIFTTEPTHPGLIIADELEARKEELLKQNIKSTSAFALSISMNPAHLLEIIKGVRNINPSIAIKLEKGFGIAADFWLRSQAFYDLQMERNKIDNQNKKAT